MIFAETSVALHKRLGKPHSYVVGVINGLTASGRLVSQQDFDTMGSFHGAGERGHNPIYRLSVSACQLVSAVIQGRPVRVYVKKDDGHASKKNTPVKRRKAMSELIPVQPKEVDGQQINTVNARELHAFLGVGKKFTDWAKDRIEQFGFVEGQDFVVVEDLSAPTSGSSKARAQKITEYHLTLDMAKELSMVERNEKGKQARQYFIECERRAKHAPALPDFTNPAIAARAWADQVEARAIAEKTAVVQAKQIEEQKPMVAFAETVSRATNSIAIADFAKVISGKAGFEIGRNRLYELLRSMAFVDYRNMPYQRYIDQGIFSVQEQHYENKGTNGPRVGFTTRITSKGQIYLLNKILPHLLPKVPQQATLCEVSHA